MPARIPGAFRFFVLGAVLAGVGGFSVLYAQSSTPPPDPSPPAEPSADAAKAPPVPPATDKGTPTPRVFTPTEEVSPDQEIDFPADL